MKRKYLSLALIFACVITTISHRFAISQETHDIHSTESIDKMRDRDLQPEKIMDVIKLHEGMIVDPDPSRFVKSDHFLTRKRELDFARDAGYVSSEVDDSFLKSHMIIVLKPAH